MLEPALRVSADDVLLRQSSFHPSPSLPAPSACRGLTWREGRERGFPAIRRYDSIRYATSSVNRFAVSEAPDREILFRVPRTNEQLKILQARNRGHFTYESFQFFEMKALRQLLRVSKPGFFDDRQNCETSSAHRSTALSALDWNCITILCTPYYYFMF